MPWIPEKYEPEKPDFEYSRKRAEGGFGMHPNEVLWCLNMLEHADSFIRQFSEEFIEDTRRELGSEWVEKYNGETNER